MTAPREELPQERTPRAPGGFNRIGPLIPLEQLAMFVDRGRAAQENVDRLTAAAEKRYTSPVLQLQALERDLYAVLAAAAPVAYRQELRAPLTRVLGRARRVLRELEAE